MTRAPSHDRPAIAVTLISLGFLGAMQGWPHMGIPIGYGCGMLLVAAWRWGR